MLQRIFGFLLFCFGAFWRWIWDGIKGKLFDQGSAMLSHYVTSDQIISWGPTVILPLIGFWMLWRTRVPKHPLIETSGQRTVVASRRRPSATFTLVNSTHIISRIVFPDRAKSVDLILDFSELSGGKWLPHERHVLKRGLDVSAGEQVVIALADCGVGGERPWEWSLKEKKWPIHYRISGDYVRAQLIVQWETGEEEPFPFVLAFQVRDGSRFASVTTTDFGQEWRTPPGLVK
ncbi:hypothetical protein [Methylocystis sp.]|uniref:hypothetical protein n=1 Tax=Methylocystis sp. TaxID=1911079 RepID=UPI003DA23E5A